MTKSVDLVNLFQGVVGALQENKTDLNEADAYNHNHGDNMVEIFQLITSAAAEKKNADAAEQLAHASEVVKENVDSGSARVYARGLAQAAEKFQGRKLTSDNAVDLLSTLLSAGDDPPQEQKSSRSMIGSLMSELAGDDDPDDQGLDAGDLLNAGLRFFQSRQRGESSMEALMDALVTTSSVGQVPHRAQSGKVIAETLISLLGSR
jgi:hypothetical protein